MDIRRVISGFSKIISADLKLKQWKFTKFVKKQEFQLLLYFSKTALGFYNKYNYFLMCPIFPFMFKIYISFIQLCTAYMVGF
jgi:hypothetical protein